MASVGRSRRRSRLSLVRSSREGRPSAHAGSGSGWTIFNNKGKPVKQYEPFFDDTHAFRFDQQVGVSATLFYDPVERVVATLHPNHTWEKVVFDPWRQEHLGCQRHRADRRPHDRPGCRASSSSAWPRPTTCRRGMRSVRAEPLGPASKPPRRRPPCTPRPPRWPTPMRSVAASSPSRTTGSNGTGAGDRHATVSAVIEEHYATRVVFDIEGNQREVIDANDRVVMRYDYDMLGTQVHQASMEAGERWMLNDVAGQPIYAWDSRGHQFRTTYDALRRPLDVLLRVGAGPDAAGESHRLWRKPAQPRGPQPAWQGRSALRSGGCCAPARRTTSRATCSPADGSWPGSTRAPSTGRPRQHWTPRSLPAHMTYDALNRPISATSPDGSVYRPRFNEANLLEKVDVHLRGATTSTPFVTNIDYDAKGQRTAY